MQSDSANAAFPYSELRWLLTLISVIHACAVNEVMVHGVPDGRPLQDGDIVNVDVSLYYQGYHADTSATFLVGNATSSTGTSCAAQEFTC